ncbi:hypothetical protein [Qingrenia yutianensis]|uniref:hypothetical protein n=1 Tax=Qingrenia yutianensis TaxID=2763676 RepID=UPI00223BEF05|nr:hypothetical protein [Qingrenia yutianensis]
MFKKFTALCIAVIFAVMQAPFACAQTEKKAEVTDFCLYNLQNNPIMGKIEKNTEFYFTANVKNTSGEPLTAKAYLAVFEKGTNALADVFESADLILENGEKSLIRTDGKIPSDIADEYFIKIFVFEKTTLTPLCTRRRQTGGAQTVLQRCFCRTERANRFTTIMTTYSFMRPKNLP